MGHHWTWTWAAVMAVAGCGAGADAGRVADLERELAVARQALARREPDSATQAQALGEVQRVQQELAATRERLDAVEAQLTAGRAALDAGERALATSRALRAELADALANGARAAAERDTAVAERDAAKAASDHLVERLAALAVVVGFRDAPDAVPDADRVRAALVRENERLQAPLAPAALTCQALIRALQLERADAADRAATLEARLKER